MGCCFSTPAVAADSTSLSTTPGRVVSQDVTREPSALSSESNKATLSRSPSVTVGESRVPAHRTALHGVGPTAAPPPQAGAPIVPNTLPPLQRPDMAPASELPQRVARIYSSSHGDGGVHPPQPEVGATAPGSNRARHMPSSYKADPLSRSMSANPLSRPGMSSLPLVRTSSDSRHSPNTKTENPTRNQQSRSSVRKNRVAGTDNTGHRGFTPTVRKVPPDNLRFRILVVGKKLSGKSSLIDAVFKVDKPTATETHRTIDINTEFVPRDNRHLIIHEYSDFEPGVVQNIPILRDFVIRRTRTNRPASESLHAVWICVPTLDFINGNLGDGVVEILRLKGVVPVVLVATKFDIVVSEILARGDTRDYKSARATAHEMCKRSCRSLFNQNSRDVPVETVSTMPIYGDLTTNLITTTHKLVVVDSRNAITPSLSRTLEGNAQIPAVPLLLEIAQRVSHDLIIQASIEVGRNRYWSTLWSSQDFTDKTLEDCIDVVHTDIIEVWDLHDEAGYLFGKEFKNKMSDVVKDIISDSSEPNIMSMVRWATSSYLNSVENIRYMMGYIVDLTVVLHGLFVTAHVVSPNKVHEVVNHHIKSGRRTRIHQDIRGFVTEDAPLFIYRERDLVLEKIIDLIKQFCVPFSGNP